MDKEWAPRYRRRKRSSLQPITGRQRGSLTHIPVYQRPPTRAVSELSDGRLTPPPSTADIMFENSRFGLFSRGAYICLPEIPPQPFGITTSYECVSDGTEVTENPPNSTNQLLNISILVHDRPNATGTKIPAPVSRPPTVSEQRPTPPDESLPGFTGDIPDAGEDDCAESLNTYRTIEDDDNNNNDQLSEQSKGSGPSKESSSEAHPSSEGQNKDSVESKNRRQHRTVKVDVSKAKSSAIVVRMCMKEMGWKEVKVELASQSSNQKTADIYWHGVSFGDSSPVTITQGMVNKYPGMLEMVRKAQLTRIMRRMENLFPDEYTFYPRTWLIPDEYHRFREDVADMQKRGSRHKPAFILKPDEGSQGEGIILFMNVDDLEISAITRSAVVQEYIPRPLLLERLKFDLRIYVIVLATNPLKIYIANEGMARFCTISYQRPAVSNIHRVFMHLTNYSLNKRSSTYVHTDVLSRGSKRTLSSVYSALNVRGYDVSTLQTNIDILVCKTIIAMLPDMGVEQHTVIPAGKPAPGCFQVLGFDILVNEDLKPFLLEINANPSMSLDHEMETSAGVIEAVHSPVDEAIKKPLIMETLKLACPKWARKRLKRRMEKVRSAELAQSDDNLRYLDSTFDTDEPALTEVYQRGPERYEHLKVLEKVSDLYIRFLGNRGLTKLGATGFRTFSRRCNLCHGGGLKTAAIDLLYIEMNRKWNGQLNEMNTGLPFDAFLDSFIIIAQRKFKSGTTVQKIQSLVDHCQDNLSGAAELAGPVRKRKEAEVSRE